METEAVAATRNGTPQTLVRECRFHRKLPSARAAVGKLAVPVYKRCARSRSWHSSVSFCGASLDSC